MLLSDLIAGLPLKPLAACDSSTRVCDLTEDSRTVVPVSMFIARPGTKADGRSFIARAIDAGAVAVVVQAPGAGLDAPLTARLPEAYLSEVSSVAILETPDAAMAGAVLAERFYGNPSRRLGLVGITGTNGKSTTAHIIHRALNASKVRTGLIGTVEIDDGISCSPAEMTTPPATEISRTLSVMVEQGCVAAAMEVSSHALDQHRVSALAFKVGVFTNLTRDHLNYHKTMEAYASAKARLFGMLPADGVAIVNTHDPAWRRMVAGCPARLVACVREGEAPPSDSFSGNASGPVSERASVRVRSATIGGMDLALTGPWGGVEVRTPLVGDHNAMNLLQAAASMWALGVPAGEWGAALARVGPPAGRLEGVSGPRDEVAAFVDYAHTPDALENVLRAVRRAAGDRTVTIVFGAGGDKDVGKRPIMGQVAARLADRIIITSDNPRSEPPASIIAQIVHGVPQGKRGVMDIHVDRERAIYFAIATARVGEIVVIAGKGHETEQVGIDEAGRPVSRHFDDREVARAALVARRVPARARE